MSARQYETTVTLELNGREESDYPIRGTVDVVPHSHGWVAELDGDAEVLLDDTWVPVEDLETTPDMVERARQSLADLALDDDSDECIDDREELFV